MAHPVVLFLGGLVVITLGALVLVRGASRTAEMSDVTTVVAIGTSMPVLAVGVTAVRSEQGSSPWAFCRGVPADRVHPARSARPPTTRAGPDRPRR
jgi:Ca2+/Na+ antiporter